MTTLREAAQQALEALEDWDSPVALPAMVALKAALAEPVQEPVAWYFEARAVALLLDLTEVRLNEPFPHLVQYYERVLEGAIRHPAVGPVKYLSVKVAP